jgi:hypothetical protein
VVHEVTQKQWGFEVAQWLGAEEGMQESASVPATNVKGDELNDDGLAVFNMQGSSRLERLLLFSFMNLFTCTDKNVTTSPTSRGESVSSQQSVLLLTT